MSTGSRSRLSRGLPWVLAATLAWGTGTYALSATAASSNEPLLSQASAPIRNIFGLRTPMRDGVQLSSDVWLPRETGRYPVILLRTPYVKGWGFMQDQPEYFSRRGYAVVIQDTRGRGDSEGEFTPFFHEANDGYDTIEHIAEQPWANGRVCMLGGSYHGTVQWLAAKTQPPHLTCLVANSPAARFTNEIPYVNGAFMMHFALQWLNATSGRGPQGNSRAVDWATVFQHRPLRTMDEAFGRKMPTFQQWLDHPTLDDYWRPVYLQPADFERIQLPILTIVGLFDADQPGAMFNWTNVEAHAPGAEHRYLILGPWTHGQAAQSTSRGEAGDRKFPPSSLVDLNAVTLAFLEKYLKQSTSRFDQPRVRAYFTGSNVWRDFTQYPTPEAKPLSLFLASGGAANTAGGDGVLSTARATGGKPTDTYVYDPRNPVVQHDLGPVTSYSIEFGVSQDRSKIQQRNDVLVYTSAPLERQLDVLGLAEVELHAASDAKDTDFTASLTDVAPDGKAISLGHLPVGIVRARYRDGNGKGSLLQPGRPYRFKIELGHIAHSFLPGHRIRLEISSSAYPLFNPNQNTGNPIADDVEWKSARQTIYHTRAQPSALRLPALGELHTRRR